jgi:oligopeptide/dipeptide ABC transporter ATP-binding protein
VALLNVENLHVSFSRSAATVEAVRGVSLRIERGQIHGLVGESGSGKSVTARAILGLERGPSVTVTADALEFEGRDLASLTEEEYREIRGSRIAVIFQEPGKHLNPALTVGRQISEVLVTHQGMDERAARRRAVELLEMVELPRPGSLVAAYPHELSGGMKQRALIAMAVSCRPALLLADEPTTALDVTVQRQILDLLHSLANELDMAVLFISHDLAVVQTIAQWVSVIYAGRILESAEAGAIFEDPVQPYTQALFQAIPDRTRRGTPLRAIPGQVPDAGHAPSGCPFHPRCPKVEQICRTQMPATTLYGARHTAACHVASRSRQEARL